MDVHHMGHIDDFHGGLLAPVRTTLGCVSVISLQFRRVRTTVQPYFEFRRKDHP
jgi:hypothetical protein